MMLRVFPPWPGFIRYNNPEYAAGRLRHRVWKRFRCDRGSANACSACAASGWITRRAFVWVAPGPCRLPGAESPPSGRFAARGLSPAQKLCPC